jgi:hypothetical protein
MGRGAFDLLKTAPFRRESAKQHENRLAGQPKILAI